MESKWWHCLKPTRCPTGIPFRDGFIRALETTSFNISLCGYITPYIYIYMCVCVCVCFHSLIHTHFHHNHNSSIYICQYYKASITHQSLKSQPQQGHDSAAPSSSRSTLQPAGDILLPQSFKRNLCFKQPQFTRFQKTNKK